MYENEAKCKNFPTYLLPLRGLKKMASIYQKKGKNVWYYCITYNGKKYQGSTKTIDKQSAKLIAEAKQTDIARECNAFKRMDNYNAGYILLTGLNRYSRSGYGRLGFLRRYMRIRPSGLGVSGNGK